MGGTAMIIGLIFAAACILFIVGIYAIGYAYGRLSEKSDQIIRDMDRIAETTERRR